MWNNTGKYVSRGQTKKKNAWKNKRKINPKMNWEKSKNDRLKSFE